MKKNSPPVPHLLQALQAPALPYAKVVGHPGTGSYPAPLPDPTTHTKFCDPSRTLKKNQISLTFPWPVATLYKLMYGNDKKCLSDLLLLTFRLQILLSNIESTA